MPKAKLLEGVASLFDMMTRHQVYLEGVKLWASNQFTPAVTALVTGLSKLFGSLDVANMGDLTKKAFAAFLAKVKELTRLVFSGHAADTITLLRTFSKAEVELTRDLYEASTGKTVAQALSESLGSPIMRKLTFDGVWQDTMAAPVAATGTTVKDMLTGFAGSAAKTVQNEVTKAYVNKTLVDDARKALTGTKKANYRDGIINRLWNQNSAVVNTALQHASSRAQAIIGSLFKDRYQWVSVLDSRTTEICRQRNGNIYRYGEGPVPPAHINCRSKIVGLSTDGLVSSPTYYDWLHQQPDSFLIDILGEKDAKRLRNGSLKGEKFPLLGEVKSLTPDGFKAKFKLITQGTDEDA